MSYVTWHNYGFGICVDDVDTQDVARLETMLKLTPELEQKIHNWLKESSINEPTWADYMEFDQDFGLGLATILQDVIRESEGICLTACNNSTARLTFSTNRIIRGICWKESEILQNRTLFHCSSAMLEC